MVREKEQGSDDHFNEVLVVHVTDKDFEEESVSVLALIWLDVAHADFVFASEEVAFHF
jgi:hypothetical protein